MIADLQEKYFEVVLTNKAYTNRYRLERYLHYMFGHTPLKDKRVLDVGGGIGLLTLWAAVEGAEALCLEPESDGSSQDMRKMFNDMRLQISSELPASSSTDSVQAFLANTDYKFDIIMMANCINHIDEENCAILHQSDEAKRSYVEYFKTVKEHLNPGGKLIITDCTRRNFFGDLGFKSPVVPSIEWHIHQSPDLWRNLIDQAGLRVDQTQWTTPNALGPLGRVVLGNPIASYFLLSQFRLSAEA